MNATRTTNRKAALQRRCLAVVRSLVTGFQSSLLWSASKESDCRGQESSPKFGMHYSSPNQIPSPRVFGTLVQV